jgi:orotidine-5'-phosphate decarboxylase
MPSLEPFGVRLRAATDRLGPLCVGIDPHRPLVEEWGLTYDLAGLERFAATCVEAFAGQVAVVKPQSAFFEVFGSAGIAVLERTILAFRDTGTLTILDAKRGDIGSTMEAYAEGLLGKDAVAAADALTVSPYLGYGALRPAVALAEQTGRGVFVLALTSNPEGPSVQHATRDGRSVAGSIVAGAAQDNAAAASRGELGSVGMVVGATVGNAVADLGLDLAGANAPLLAPGLGAQGGTAADIRRVFGDAWRNALPSASRSVLRHGPDAAALRSAAVAEVEALGGT